ncbi:hypothetical protein FBEOM_13527 [Fusarium beomiforme]|uniref:Uncharacterized protein n=1 Tax=Fusarium beomiforme TaxID=44412 RepID=A0A9P5DMP0_9HYPO|nr:hypothetical protein FBEOM_13527 [Fusarium beomiforme]
MTARGRNVPIPLPPRDPTLESRPVPWERHYPVRAFGPGAAPEAQQNFQSIEELAQQSLNASSVGNDWDVEEDAKHLFKLLTKESNIEWRDDGFVTGEPTWGPPIVVTAYSEKARGNIDLAVNNLVEIIHRYFLRCPRSGAFATEAFKRLKFDVIEDKELLENASDDRVREEFNAYVRSLRLFPDDLRWENQRQKLFKDNLNRPDGPTRYNICIVLDEETVDTLAAISFPDNLKDDLKILQDISIKVIDRNWRYPQIAEDKYGSGSSRHVYKGKDTCPILDLPLICAEIYGHAGLEEMFPLDRYRYMR